MSSTPEGWIKQVETSILQSKEIPMWGAFPGFPWKEFAQAFASVFNLKQFNITSGDIEWKKSATVLAGMGSSPFQLSLELTPLQGSFSLIVPSEDFAKLSSWILDPKAEKEGFSDPFLQKGFFRYIALEALNLVDRMKVLQNLTPKLIEMPLSKEDAYCIDITLEKEGEVVWGRLVCPSLFHSAFKDHFAGDWQLSIPSRLYEEIDVDLSLSAGRTTLTQEQWTSAKEGDLIFLDYCSYSPYMNRGTFQLVSNQFPLFQVKLKDENVKILDYALYYEENKMSDENVEGPKEDLPKEDLTDESSFEDEDTTPSGEEEEKAEQPTPAEQKPSEGLVSPKEVPIHLTVEVAHMKINLDKLLKLKPGNILEFNVSPKQGVNLVANGKCMAKGDLVQIGDVIGVKITKMGNA